MKKISLLLAVLLASLYSHAQHSYPAYRTIVTELCKQYDLSDEYIRIVKTRRGYELESYDRDLGRYTHRQLFWSVKSGNYEPLEDMVTGVSRAAKKEELVNDPQAFQYDLFPYYAYTGWEQDVIGVLSGIKSKSDDELYALGRAYSSLSMGRYNNNYGFADSSLMFSYAESGQNIFNKEQLNYFIGYTDSAHFYFKTLQQRNPRYNTKVGSIGMKGNNEVMYKYTVLQMYQNDDIARSEVKDIAYNYAQIDFARKILAACAPNAILLTRGDNDYYATLYVQQFQDYRKDVTILNLSLLDMTKYVNFVRDYKWGREQPVHMQLSKEDYANKKLAFIYLMDAHYGQPECMTADSFLRRALIRDESLGYTYVNSKCVAVSAPKAQFLSLHYSDRSYLYQSDLATIDIINSNYPKRPVYFVSNEDPAIAEYLQLRGPIFAFSDQKTFDIQAAVMFVNSLDGAQLKNDPEFALHPSYPGMITQAYARLINEYTQLADEQNKVRYIKHYLDEVPNSMFHVGTNLMSIILNTDYKKYPELYDRMLMHFIQDARLGLDMNPLEQGDLERLKTYIPAMLEVCKTKNEKLRSELKNLEIRLKTKKAI